MRDEGGYGLFTITCLSEMILLDAFLRPLKHLPEDVVKVHLGDTLESCELYAHFAGTRIVQGWNGAYQRPCEDDMAIAKGSAFCFFYELSKGKTTQDLAQSLNTLKRTGLGLRRAEGFGEIVINDPFHVCFPNQISEGEDKNA
jgi:CRISPR-associated protein Csx10